MANNCKVFTPQIYVLELLNAIKYKKHLYGKKVLENSCGDGFILKEIVRRYIKDCIKENMSKEVIISGLEQDIYGVELEEEHKNKCIENLNLVASEYNLYEVNWRIILGNYLEIDVGSKFDYVIGNPPYITYRDIDKKERESLKEKFQVCFEGKFDYYYAFFEKGILELTTNGKLAYIVPASIYKNVFAQRLRDYMREYITDLFDYTYESKFPGVTTSSTILVIDKSKSAKTIKYHDVIKKEKRVINKSDLQTKWSFKNNGGNDGRYRFGDYYKVSNTIATLYNKAFLLENAEVKDNLVYNNGKPVEIEVVCDAVSRKRSGDISTLKIIFPYRFRDGKVEKYKVDEFESLYPCASEYLRQFIKHLHNRDADDSTQWFEYGRSQAICHMNKPKITIPSIITSKVEPLILPEKAIPCAGFIIISKEYSSLEDGKKVLESKNFLNYLDEIGIFTTGKSRRVTVKDIENYRFDRWGE